MLKGPLILLASTLFTLLIFECSFRVFHFVAGNSTESLQQQLEKSKATQPEELQGSVTLAGLIEPSPWSDVVYQLKPNLTGRFQGKSLHTNALGMRDREYAVAKPENVIRIAGIGDSVMFGWGVELEQTYLKLLEKSLNESLAKSGSSHRVEVMNFAVPGYNTAMEVALLERKVLAFSPDIVLMHFVNNDYDVPAFMELPDDPFSLSRSYLLEFIRHRLDQSGRSELVGIHNALSGANKSRVLKEYRWMTGPTGFKRAVERLAEISKEKTFELVMVSGSLRRDQRKLISASAKKFDFKHVDIGPYVQKYSLDNNLPKTKDARKALLWVTPTDPHPSPLGHKLYAGALEQQLQTALHSKLN